MFWRRAAGARLLHLLLLCLVLSLALFLFTTPAPIGRTDTGDVLPWEQGPDSEDVPRGASWSLHGYDALLDTMPKNHRRKRTALKPEQQSLPRGCAHNGSWAELTWEQRQAVAQRLVVLDEASLLYCAVPLVGNGPWLKVAYLLGPHGRDLDDVTLVPSKEVTNRKNFVYLSSFPPKEQNRRLRDYTKVMVSRHPFSRVAVAYKMKFEADNAFFHKRYGSDIVARYRHGAQRGPSDGSDVTFSEFVEYIVAAEEEELNEHWRPLASLCRPCQLDYDTVLHYETLGTDSGELLSRLGMGERVPAFPPNTWDTVAVDYVRWQLESVAPARLGQLVRRYWADFDLFSYSSAF